MAKYDVGWQIVDPPFQLHQLTRVTRRRRADWCALEARNLQLKFLDQKAKVDAFLLLNGELLLQLCDGGVALENESF